VRLLKYFLLAMAMLFVTSSSWGSCSFANTYAMYNSQSYDGVTVFATITTSGSSDMSGCPIPPGTLHTPKAYNTLTNTRTGVTTGPGWKSGTAGCPSCYITVTNTVSVAASVGDDFREQANGQIFCTLAGNFWTMYATFPQVDLQPAFTKSKNMGGTPYYWLLTPWCTPETTPPNWAPFVSFNSVMFPYYFAESICVSASFLPPGWHCSPGPEIGEEDPTKYACTKTPPVH
jgi:hypothetical protein